jgi:hypothetical protein
VNYEPRREKRIAKQTAFFYIRTILRAALALVRLTNSLS